MTDISSQTLHIVAKELNATLNDARASLEAYAEHPEQRALLEKCADQLHSAHGVLRLVEVYGAALLAEEMEHVTRYLLSSDNDQKRHVDGLDALMRAMVQLPTYLERVMSGGRDLALVLLPLLNDLRSVRGSPLLSEGTLLLLNLKSDQPAQPLSQRQDELSISVAQWARRLRPRFQIGLLGYIRGERTVQNLEILAKVAEKLEQVATTQPVFQLWWVVGAILEAVRANGLEGLVPRHVQLDAQVQIRSSQENMQPRSSRGFQRLNCGIHVIFTRARKCRDRYGANFLRHFTHRFQIAARGNGKSGLNYVHTQRRQLVRHANFLRRIHGETRRLLTVAQGGIEYAHYVHRQPHA